MADSEVDICNRAISFVGVGRQITSLDPAVDTSQESRHCNLHYIPVRDALLERFDWYFNNSWSTVASIDSITHPVWDCVYQYPADALRVRYVMPLTWNPELWKEGDNIPFETGYHSGKRVVLTNEANATIIYGVAVTDTKLFPPTFDNALAWAVALAVAMGFTGGKRGVIAEIIRGYGAALQQALAADGLQANISSDVEASFITDRTL